MRVRHAIAVAVGVAVGVLVVAGCGDPPPSAGRFCERLAADRDLVVSGAGAGADTDLVVERFLDLERMAPAEIRGPWTTVTDLVEAVAEVDLDDEAARRSISDQVYAAQPAAAEVATWARERCAVDLGPVISIASPAPEG